MSNEKNKISNEELLDFLKFAYFGDLNISIKVASNRAYRDMCRTLKFDVLPKDTKATIISELKEAVNVIFKEEIPIINEGNITSPEEFNLWHCKVCGIIKDLYEDYDIKFTYGQAQKWVNMNLKYQKDIRERIEKDSNIDVPPLLWEFKNWLEVAKGNNKN